MGKQLRLHPFQAVRGALSHRQHPDWGLTMEPPFAFLQNAALCTKRIPECRTAPLLLTHPHGAARPSLQGPTNKAPPRAPRGFAQCGHVCIHPPAPPAPRLPNASLKSEPGHRVGEAEGTAATPCCTTPFGGSDGAALGRAHHGFCRVPRGAAGGRSRDDLAPHPRFAAPISPPRTATRARGREGARGAGAARGLLAPPCGAQRYRAERVRTAPVGSAPLYCGCAGSGPAPRPRAGCKRRREMGGREKAAWGG